MLVATPNISPMTTPNSPMPAVLVIDTDQREAMTTTAVETKG